MLRRDRIVRKGGEFCVESRDGSRSFGCFATEALAGERLRQVEAAKARGDKVRPGGKGFEIVNEAGVVVGSYETEEQALEHERAMTKTDAAARRLARSRRRVDCSKLPLVHRIDRIAWRMDLEPPPGNDFATPEKLDNGMVDVWGIATRVGVFDYEDASAPDGVFRELRPAAEVLDEASLSTLRAVTFTIDHPDDDVTADNFRDLAHGFIRSVVVDGPHLWTLIRVASRDALQAASSGKIELSCGYSAHLEERAGVFRGERFDAIQREIRYNHLALVDAARAGPVARLKLDSLRVQRRAA